MAHVEPPFTVLGLAAAVTIAAAAAQVPPPGVATMREGMVREM